MGEPVDVLTGKPADVVTTLIVVIGFVILAAVLLALPGAYLAPSSTHVAGVLSFVVVASASAPLPYRARHGV